MDQNIEEGLQEFEEVAKYDPEMARQLIQDDVRLLVNQVGLPNDRNENWPSADI